MLAFCPVIERGECEESERSEGEGERGVSERSECMSVRESLSCHACVCVSLYSNASFLSCHCHACACMQ